MFLLIINEWFLLFKINVTEFRKKKSCSQELMVSYYSLPNKWCAQVVPSSQLWAPKLSGGHRGIARGVAHHAFRMSTSFLRSDRRPWDCCNFANSHGQFSDLPTKMIWNGDFPLQPVEVWMLKRRKSIKSDPGNVPGFVRSKELHWSNETITPSTPVHIHPYLVSSEIILQNPDMVYYTNT